MKMYQVDAFSQNLFKGNPAAVLVLTEWLSDELMQQIALENNLAETAFVKIIDDVNYEIRWFSPKVEIEFCGHATLASAYVLFKDYCSASKIYFHVKKMGIFIVDQAIDGKIHMNFPIRRAEKLHEVPELIYQAIDRPVVDVYINAQAYILVCASEQDVREATPNLDVICQIGADKKLRTAITSAADSHDIVITASADDYDYVARYFAPNVGINEDPVTGSLHTGLAPFWAERLNKTELIAYQASERGGTLYCILKDDERIEISGYAKLFMIADLFLD